MSTGLLTDSEKLFGTRNLYDALSIAKTASKAEVHPDRVDKKDRVKATEKFQVLGKIYSILSDCEKRKVYDETGSVDDESDIAMDRDWSDYWRLLFPRINVKDIETFANAYRQSDEELSDLKAAYLEHAGDMDHILDSIMCCTVEDEERFREALVREIEAGEVPAYDAFTKEKPAKQAARRRKAARERAEAEHEEKKRTKNGDSANSNDLHSLIAARQKSREQQSDVFFEQLEQKYGAKSSVAKKKAKK